MKTNLFALCIVCLAGCCLIGCAAPTSTDSVASRDGFKKAGNGKFDTSVEGIILDFEFEGELVTDWAWSPHATVEDQLLYTIGHLNGDNSVGRLDQLQLTNVQTSSENGMTKITYSATLPVAWGKRDDIPATYEFTIPKNVSSQGQEDFTDKYKDTCVDWSAHDVDSGVMWYYYRPSRCTVDAEDVVTFTANVSVSTVNTTGKYPEYHKVWEDNVLKVVAVFGKNEDGATDNDVGIDAYNSFVSAVDQRLATATSVTTEPATVPALPGVDVPDVTYNAVLADGKEVQVNVLLVDNVRTAGLEFDQRYEALSTEADLIIYNGHAGLGANIRALASKGSWATGQYAIVFMNGCDTYAYVDSALADAHVAVNPDDPDGTKYLDIVTNAMPAFFYSLKNSTMAMVNGLLSYENPQTYEQMFAAVDPAQVVLVSGEQDNVYYPGYTPGGGGGGGGTAPWSGLNESASLAQGELVRYETGMLPAGDYTFEITGTGDADLYVRVGTAPDMDNWDCRPYRYGSAETCQVSLAADAPVHVMVHGWSEAEFTLAGSEAGSL